MNDEFSSRPIRIRPHLQEKLEARIEAVPLFNVLLIAVLLLATGSGFVFAPGVPVALDGERARTLVLPTASVPLSGADPSAVLTVKSDTMFIFDGRIFESLEAAFSQETTTRDRGVLLVKLDRSVSVQGLFRIAELAGKAGFSSLQIAGESPSYRPAELPRR